MMIRRKRSYSNELSQKIETEENPTARNSMFDHEKAYVDAAPPSSPHKNKNEVLTEQVLAEEPVMSEEIKSDVPEADFKGVFEIKESKSKHKANKKKSKSKLKGRLLGKGSDNEEEEEQAGDLSNMTEENDELSKEGGSLSEEYNVMQDEVVE